MSTSADSGPRSTRIRTSRVTSQQSAEWGTATSCRRNERAVTETRKLFHEELKELADDVARLGALAGEAIQAGTAAFLAEDLPATEKVIENDQKLDELTHDIEKRTYSLLARQQPMAVD